MNATISHVAPSASPAALWAVDTVVDTRGGRCPTPVVEAGRVLRGLASGASIELISDCPGATSDILSWARKTGNRLVETVEAAPGESHFRLQKG